MHGGSNTHSSCTQRMGLMHARQRFERKLEAACALCHPLACTEDPGGRQAERRQGHTACLSHQVAVVHPAALLLPGPFAPLPGPSRFLCRRSCHLCAATGAGFRCAECMQGMKSRRERSRLLWDNAEVAHHQMREWSTNAGNALRLAQLHLPEYTLQLSGQIAKGDQQCMAGSCSTTSSCLPNSRQTANGCSDRKKLAQ